jgi:hypothetical protein
MNRYLTSGDESNYNDIWAIRSPVVEVIGVMEGGSRGARVTAGSLLLVSIFLPWWITFSKVGGRVALNLVGLFVVVEGSSQYLTLKMSSLMPNSHPLLSVFFLALLIMSMVLIFAGGRRKVTVGYTLIIALLSINLLYFFLEVLTHTTQPVDSTSSVAVPFIGFVTTLMAGVMGRRSLPPDIGEAPRRKPIDGGPLQPSAVKPTPPRAVENEARKPLVKDVTSVLSPLDLDDRVYEYIVEHGGTISLSKTTMELGVTSGELDSSIDRLKKIGKLG